MMDADTRLTELETRYAYLEATVQTLNDVIARQQRDIDQLVQTCQQLAERIARSSEPGFKGSLADEVPPHY